MSNSFNADDAIGKHLASHPSYSDFLCHHGIKGQKWGVKNGPPYPLSEAKAARVRMNAKHRPYPDHWYSKKSQREAIGEHQQEGLSELKHADPDQSIESLRAGINPDGPGREYNCPNCAAAFELTERGYDVVARPKMDGSNVENIESFFKNGTLKNFNEYAYGKDLSELDSAWKHSDDLLVAKNLKEDIARKALSEIRGKYETPDKVPQNAKDSVMKLVKDYRKANDEFIEARNSFYSLMTKAREETKDRTLSALKSQGDGARGIIVVGWQMNFDPKKRTSSYHAFNYKVKDGDVKFYDAQSRRSKKQNGGVGEEFFYEIDPRDCYTMRTDNLELSPEITKAVYSNRRSK